MSSVGSIVQWQRCQEYSFFFFFKKWVPVILVSYIVKQNHFLVICRTFRGVSSCMDGDEIASDVIRAQEIGRLLFQKCSAATIGRIQVEFIGFQASAGQRTPAFPPPVHVCAVCQKEPHGIGSVGITLSSQLCAVQIYQALIAQACILEFGVTPSGLAKKV